MRRANSEVVSCSFNASRTTRALNSLQNVRRDAISKILGLHQMYEKYRFLASGPKYGGHYMPPLPLISIYQSFQIS